MSICNVLIYDSTDQLLVNPFSFFLDISCLSAMFWSLLSLLLSSFHYLFLFLNIELQYIFELFHKDFPPLCLCDLDLDEIASTETPAAVSAQSFPGLSYWSYWSGLRPLRTEQSERLSADRLGNLMR